MRGIKSALAFTVLVVLLLLAGSFCTNQNILTDPQGNIYKTVKIGNQIWMAENLKYDVGDDCYCYDNDPVLCEEMGRLYTWAAAQKASEILPGWHLPTKAEWEELITSCGFDSVGYAKITSEELGFNPQWSGVRISTGTFKAKGLGGVNYWGSTPSDTNVAYVYSVAVMSNLKIISPHNYPIKNACSVRLIKDD